MARRRLNVRFLVALVTVAGVLLVAAAVTGWWYKESPGRAVARAEEAELRGDWLKAAEQWAKAAKAANSPEYQLKAIEASLKRTSEPEGLQLLQQIHQNYTALLASDPTLLPALRGQMRLLAGDRSFAGPRASAATREVRRLAGEVLKQEPGDSEARTFRALATINLSQFTGEAISPAELEQGELELRSVAEINPGNGLAVQSLAQRMLNQADQLRQQSEPDAALERWQETVKLLDEVVQKHATPAAEPTLDQARLHWRLGQAYSLAARIKPLLDAVKLASAGTAQQIDVKKLAADPVVVEAQHKAYEHIAAARNALDDDRDILQEDYREIRTAYADSLIAQEKTREGEDELRLILEARPWDVQAAATYARLLQQQNRLAEGVEVVREARRREADALPPLEGHAGVNARINRMLLRPFVVELLFLRHDSVQDAAERAALLAEATEIHQQYETQRIAIGYPATSESTRMQAQIQMAQGDLGGSIQTLTSALRFTAGAQTPVDRRERLKVLGLLVDANRRMGQTGAQQRYLEEMVQLAPGLVRLQRDLAQIYLAQGDRPRARALIQRLLQESPDDPTLQQMAIQATPAEEQQAVYAQMPEASAVEQQAKLGAALRMANGPEIIRLAQMVQDGLPPADERTPEQQRQHEALTLTIAQQLGLAGRKDEAVALVTPLAEKNQTAKALLAQLEGGTEALIESLPEGAGKLMLEAQLAEMRQDTETALAKLEEANRVAPENDTVGNRLFGAYLARQRIDDAQRLAERLRARNADEMQGSSYGVRLALARGDIDEAVRAATTLARNYPQFAEAMALHGEALRQAGRPGEAVDSFRRSLELAPNSTATLTSMLGALEAAGRYRDARPYIDAGLRLQANSTVFLNADRAFQIRFGDPTQVIEARRIALQDNPDSIDAHLDLGQTLLLAAGAAERVADEVKARELLAEAARVLGEAVQKFPQEVRLLQGLVAAASRAGPDAMAAAEPAVQASVVLPDAPLAKDPMGVALAAEYYARRENLPRAESIVRSALGEPSLSREQKSSLLLTLSGLLVRQLRTDDALAVLSGYEDVAAVLQRKVELLASRVAEEPQDASVYQAMRQASDPGVQDRTLPIGALGAVAYAEMQRGDIDRAIMLLDQALSRQAANPRALLMRGAAEARRQGGDLERAARWLEQARRLSPDEPDVHRELASLQRRRGQQEDAIASLTRLTELEPQDIQTRIELVNVLLSLNPPRFAEANRQFRAAERAGVADNPFLLMSRAQMERLRGRIDDGLPFARRAVEVAEDAQAPQALELLKAYFELLLEAKRFVDVLDRTQPMLAAQGGAPWWALQSRGHALAGLNRKDEAIALYRQAVTAATPLALDDAVLVDMNRNLGFEATYALIKDKVEPRDGSTPQPRDLLVASALFSGAGRVERAIALLEEARKREADLTPEQRSAMDAQLGTLFLQVSPRRLEDSVSHLRRAIETQPEHLGLLNNLAYALTLQGEQARESGQTEAALAKLSEAVEIARRAHELNAAASRRLGRDPSATILDTYGWATGLLGMTHNNPEQLQESLRLLREARRISEDAGRLLPEVYLHLSRLLAVQQEGQSAQDAAETGLAALERVRTGPDPLDPHLEAELRAALESARDMAGKVQPRPPAQGASGASADGP